MKVSVVVPVHRAGDQLGRQLHALRLQSPELHEILIAETDPSESSRALVEEYGGRHLPIAAAEFDHAGTRSAAARATSGDVVVMMSQDVIPVGPDALARLAASLDSVPDATSLGVAASYGRQLSEPGSHPLMQLKRSYLYPPGSDERSLADRDRLGFRAMQMSNAFASYRRDGLEAIDYFGDHRLVCEDVGATVRLLRAGYRIRYVADAAAIHAHRWSLANEFRRYFDIGAAYQADPAIFQTGGQPGREGWRFLDYGLRWLVRSGKGLLIPQFLMECACKRVAFALGRRAEKLPSGVAARLSTLPQWWYRQHPSEPLSGLES